MTRNLIEITEIYNGSNGDATKALYDDLQKHGPMGDLAVNLFRAHKTSARAKVYRGGERGRGSYKRMAYEKKQWSMNNLCAALTEHSTALGICWGWKVDPKQEFHNWVLYVDLPTGQISFHTAHRGDGPDYTGDWDGVKDAGAGRICLFIAGLLEESFQPHQPTLFPVPAERGPTEPILRQARIIGDYRIWLKRVWGGGPCILWCGTNPSTANHLIDDPTIWREMRFSFLWGFGSMIKINVYPYRSPDMKKLRAWLKKKNNDDNEAREWWIRNCQEIGEHVAACDLHMAAWGKGVDRDDLELFLEGANIALIDEREVHSNPCYEPPAVQWHCLAVNDDGSPRHTLARGKLRVPDTAKPVLWGGAT